MELTTDQWIQIANLAILLVSVVIAWHQSPITLLAPTGEYHVPTIVLFFSEPEAFLTHVTVEQAIPSALKNA